MKDLDFSKINIKTLPKHAKHLVHKFTPYASFAFIITILSMYVFLAFQISQASQAEPSPDTISQQANTVKRLRIDQQSIDKILQLQDQNVNVQSLFETARDNPFQEQ